MEKLTIIIPTYERQKFMKRSMQYWSGKGVVVIFIDGSKVGLEASLLTHIKSNIIYIHNPVGVYQRILSAINLVHTEYVMLGCDDEFYITSALNSCLHKLSSDPNLVSCAGRAVGFNWNGNSVIGYNVYGKLKNLSLDNSNPEVRLYKHFSNYVPAHVYAVCKAYIWKIAAYQVFSKEYNFYAASELQLEFILSFAGKTLVIPELLWMRSGECKPLHGTGKSIIPSLTFYKWWVETKNKKEKEDFISRMEFACRQISGIKKNDKIPKVENIFEIYLRSEKTSIFFKLYKYLPYFIRNIIKIILKLFRYDVTKKTLFIDVVTSLEKTGVKVDFAEITLIKKFIYSFYKD